MIDAPANDRSDKDTCNQFGGEAETSSHRRCVSGGIPGPTPGLIYLVLAVFPYPGKTLIQIVEPCGERSFVG